MKINYLTKKDPSDILSWSGTPYFLSKGLSQLIELEYIYDLNIRIGVLDYLKKISCKVRGYNYELFRTENILKRYALNIESRVRNNSNIIFSPSSNYFSFLNCKNPKVFYTDACYAGMVGFYPAFSNFCKSNIYEGNRLEQMAMDNSDLIIYSSDWAAKSAIENYKVTPDKIKVVPFGANIEHFKTREEIESSLTRKKTRECHLLFIGVEWERKRGDFAIRVAELLNKNGLPTTLHLVGINKLKNKKFPKFVINHGFICKSSMAGKNQLEQLFLESHFLLVPTMAEAYGLVFAEAGAYGLPSIATNVGGVSTIIKNDFNGYAFPLDKQPSDYARYIEKVFSNPALYRNLAMNAFNYTNTHLTWQSSSESIVKLLKQI